VKPNSESQGVEVHRVANPQEFNAAVLWIIARDRVFLVQRPAVGRDYRIVVLDGAVVAAYERRPCAVIGDGQSTIADLLVRHIQMIRAAGRDVPHPASDRRVDRRLRHLGLQWSDVPALGTRIALVDHANLSAGGDAIDVSDAVHPTWTALASGAVRDLGLRFGGLDIIVDGDIRAPVGDYRILECNAAPSLAHFARLGPLQLARVERIYRTILTALPATGAASVAERMVEWPGAAIRK
jgi:D-alanine-D-alanine ligase-like ATP-grasp enzyme